MEKKIRLRIFKSIPYKFLGVLIALVISNFVFSLNANADSKIKTVTGIVTSKATKEPLVGVAVFVANSPYNAITDINGKYTLRLIPKKNTVINFQLLGMTNQQVKYNGQKVINIQLEDDKQMLNDVVVTGYVNIRKQGFTGNTTKITKDEILKVSPKNTIAAIQIFDPSFRIVDNINAGSDPNHLPEFYMRGRTAVKMDPSIAKTDISRQNLTNNNNLPIFILDGFEVSPEKIYDLDPNRITSLTLLKDAAATALYGSRAANGVVVIETRAPQEGKLRVTYNLNAGIEIPDLTGYNLMNSKEKLAAEVASGYYKLNTNLTTNDITDLGNYEYYIDKLNNVNRGVNTYWIGQPVRTAINNRNSLYIEGGSKSLRWGTELRYSNNKGVMKGTDRSTYGGGFILDYRAGKVQFMNRLNFDAMKANELPHNNFSDYAHLDPYIIFKDPNTGKYLRTLTDYNNIAGNILNPLYELTYMKSFNVSKYDDISNKFSINYFINKDLTLKGQLSLSQKHLSSNIFIDPNSSSFANISDPKQLGSLSTGEGLFRSVNFNALLLFNKNIGKNYINITSGAEIIQNYSENINATYKGFPSGSLNSINNAVQIMSKPVRSSNLIRLASFITMANYSYDDIYLLDGSLRFDGSSEFGSDKKIAPFWATGVGINIHNYPFLKGNKTLNQLKIRATYGQVGKVNFPVYAAKSSYTSTSTQSWYITGMGNIMNYLGNSNLAWEKTNSFDTGFDIGLFDNRFTMKFTYYNKITEGMITSVSLPSSSGFSSYMDNIGRVKNSGIELDLRYTPYRSKDWEITLFGNISHNSNRLLKISEALKNYNKKIDDIYNKYRANTGLDYNSTRKYTQVHTKFVEGGSTTSIFAVKSLGINPANGKEIYLRPNGEITYDWNTADQVIVGDTEPLVQGAFGFNARWKEFSMFTTFLYKYGGQQYNQTLVDYVEDVIIIGRNADKRVGKKRWKNPGDVVPFKDLGTKALATRPTSRFIQQDNVLRLNSISLSYDFQSDLIKKWGISMLRFTAGMEDIGYWSTIRRERGINYPYSHKVNFSLNITF